MRLPSTLRNVYEVVHAPADPDLALADLGGSCGAQERGGPLEAAVPDQKPAATWRKSRASADAGACVEVASLDSSVLVRDSRNTSGAVLALTRAEWLRLLRRIREQE